MPVGHAYSKTGENSRHSDNEKGENKMSEAGKKVTAAA
jgi:hypothetical protein